MKALVFFPTIFLSIMASAQVPGRIDLHRQAATITNLQGRAFTNIALIAANEGGIVYSTSDGVLGQISYTNLEVGVLQRYGIPTDRIESVRNAAKRQRETAAQEIKLDADERAKLLDPANLFEINVQSIGEFGRYSVSIGKQSQVVYVQNMPPEIPEHLSQVTSLEQSIAQLDARIKIETAQLSQQRAMIRQSQLAVDRQAASTTTGLSSVLAQPQNPDLATVNLRAASESLDDFQNSIMDQTEQLSDLRSKLVTLKKGEQTIVTLHVLRSRHSLNGFPILIVGSPR